MNYFKFPTLFLIPVVLSFLLFIQKSYAQWKIIDTGIEEKYFSAAEDSSGNLWFGVYDGLIKYDGEKFSKEISGMIQIIRIVVDTAGNIWLGTIYNGLYVYNGITTDQIENEYFVGRGSQIRGIALDKDGSIWVGTGGGLRHFKDNE